ncbi:MAG: hypothetical protein SOR75_11475 [Synergistes jonesii]|uniref:hypothetical protein n=1 Tax=Synergistes jonesii TaxID=2754 RepID=UPI002A765C5E|nr:hypothetical protein [Synergistes jonesii]MDY2985930.1 hypothetical protein [Synergistes jonesii]
MTDKQFSLSFPKSRHADYQESVALAKESAILFKEKNTKDGIVNFATYEYSADSVAKALTLMRKISRYPNAYFHLDRKKVEIKEAWEGLSCYRGAGCPEEPTSYCLPEESGDDLDVQALLELKDSVFCNRIGLGDGMYPWWTTGSFEKKEDGSLVWKFGKKKLRSNVAWRAKQLVSCPILPIDKINGFIDALPDEMPITTQMGFLDFYEKMGIAFNLDDYIKQKSQEYSSHSEDLVIISHHSPTCALCRHWHGKVYSISGYSSKYPPLKLAIQGGLFHPGCIHCEGLYLDDSTESSHNNLQKTTTLSPPKIEHHTSGSSQFGGCGCALYVITITLFLVLIAILI